MRRVRKDPKDPPDLWERPDRRARWALMDPLARLEPQDPRDPRERKDRRNRRVRQVLPVPRAQPEKMVLLDRHGVAVVRAAVPDHRLGHEHLQLERLRVRARGCAET